MYRSCSFTWGVRASQPFHLPHQVIFVRVIHARNYISDANCDTSVPSPNNRTKSTMAQRQSRISDWFIPRSNRVIYTRRLHTYVDIYRHKGHKIQAFEQGFTAFAFDYHFSSAPSGSRPAAFKSAFISSMWFKNWPLRLSHILGSCTATSYRRQGQMSAYTYGPLTVQLARPFHREIRDGKHHT